MTYVYVALLFVTYKILALLSIESFITSISFCIWFEMCLLMTETCRNQMGNYIISVLLLAGLWSPFVLLAEDGVTFSQW